MKVIDLLNKIAKGEVPKKVVYHGFLYRVKGNNYYSKDIDEYLISDLGILNEEIEIIEDTPNGIRKSIGLSPKEDKKIEKLVGEDKGMYIDYRFCNIVGKINEIIDKLNGEDNE